MMKPRKYLPVRLLRTDGSPIGDADMLLSSDSWLHTLLVVDHLLSDASDLFVMSVDAETIVIDDGQTQRRAALNGCAPFNRTVYFKFADDH